MNIPWNCVNMRQRSVTAKRFIPGQHKGTLSGGTELIRGHEGNKLAAVWLTKEQFQQLQEFLDRFSAGETFSEQLRKFLVWTANQKERASLRLLP